MFMHCFWYNPIQIHLNEQVHITYQQMSDKKKNVAKKKKMLLKELKLSYSTYAVIPFPYQIKQIVRIYVKYNSYLCCKNCHQHA